MKFFSEIFGRGAKPQPIEQSEPPEEVKKLVGVLRKWNVNFGPTTETYPGDNDMRNSLLKEIMEQASHLSKDDYEKACQMANLGIVAIGSLDQELYQRKKAETQP